MLVIGIIVTFYVISLVILSAIMFFLLHYIFLQYKEDLNELGADKLLLLNPFFFPVKRARKIMEEKKNQKFQKFLSLISFYKYYAIIGVIVCVPCMYFLSTYIMN